MSLPARQQRALNAIEGALEASEPRMTAMFAIFARLTRGEKPTSTERLRRRPLIRVRPRILYLLFPAFATAALIATLVVGLTSGSRSGCGAAASASPASGTAANCAARALNNHRGGP
jgi:hypothetical protein